MSDRPWIEAVLDGRPGRARRDEGALYPDEWLFVPDDPRNDIDHSHPRQAQAGFVLKGRVVGPPPWWKYASQEGTERKVP